ncbi:hypothetical protein ES703_70796 [subsurface metagenome]
MGKPRRNFEDERTAKQPGSDNASPKKVEDLEDMLAMEESLSAPEEEAVNFEDYDRQRARFHGKQ